MHLMVNGLKAAFAAFFLANTAFGADSPAGTTSPSAAQSVDSAKKLEISGTPRASDVAGAAYTFEPTTTNPEGGTLKFAIKNMPAWARFDTATGKLTGTPNLTQLGTYHSIVVSVSNGRESAHLPQFSIAVTAGSATLSWIAPTHTTNGTPIRDLAGYTVYYGTSPDDLIQIIDLPDPTATGYVLKNLTAGRYYFAVSSYTWSAPPSNRSAVESVTIQ